MTLGNAPILWHIHLHLLASMVVDDPDAVPGCSPCRLALSAAKACGAALVHVPPALDVATGSDAQRTRDVRTSVKGGRDQCVGQRGPACMPVPREDATGNAPQGGSQN